MECVVQTTVQFSWMIIFISTAMYIWEWYSTDEYYPMFHTFYTWKLGGLNRAHIEVVVVVTCGAPGQMHTNFNTMDTENPYWWWQKKQFYAYSPVLLEASLYSHPQTWSKPLFLAFPTSKDLGLICVALPVWYLPKECNFSGCPWIFFLGWPLDLLSQFSSLYIISVGR